MKVVCAKCGKPAEKAPGRGKSYCSPECWGAVSESASLQRGISLTAEEYVRHKVNAAKKDMKLGAYIVYLMNRERSKK